MSFDEYCRLKEASAAAAILPPYITVADAGGSAAELAALGDPWSRRLFDGAFYRTARPLEPTLPIVNLVFVQSRDGNTGAADPSTLGGGETDKHLIYEGLSRVDVDAVMAGATTAREPELVFSVWHPAMVRLRQSLGRPRHPAQVIVTNSGVLPWDRSLLLQTPALRVFVVVPTRVAAQVAARAADRPWISVVDAGEPVSLTRALRALHDQGVRTVSAVGGRRTAAALLRERLVSDLYLTTAAGDGGEPDTPFYDGPPLPLTPVVEKAGTGPEAGVRFTHSVLRPTGTRAACDRSGPRGAP